MNSMNSENISTFKFVQEMTEKDDSLSLIYAHFYQSKPKIFIQSILLRI